MKIKTLLNHHLWYSYCLLLLFAPITSFGEQISDLVQVESRLPAYLNEDTAVLVIKSTDLLTEEITLKIEFVEKTENTIPRTPVNINISPEADVVNYNLDISDWPDGEYKVIISEYNSGLDDYMIRAIRKQTIAEPTSPNEPINVASNIQFVDDWYIQEKNNINIVLNQPETYPLFSEELYQQYPYYRTSLGRFFFDGDYIVVELIGRAHLTTDIPFYYYKRSIDLENWESVDNDYFENKYQEWLQENTPPSRLCTQISHYGANPDGEDVVYRYYQDSDGEVPLSEIEIRYVNYNSEDAIWGDLTLTPRSTIPVWKKSSQEVVILRGPITKDKWMFDENEIGDWDNSNDNLGTQRLSADGQRLYFSQTRLIPRNDPLVVHYDNIYANRIQVMWMTTNGFDWQPSYFSVPYFDDPQELQHYDVHTFWEEGGNLQLGYLRMYNQVMQQISTELVYSRDGIYWQRVENRPKFLSNGERGSWNYGYSMISGISPLEHNSYMYQPIIGIDCLHFMYLCAFSSIPRENITISWLESWQGGRLFGEQGIEGAPFWNHYKTPFSSNSQAWQEILEDIHNAITAPGIMKFRKNGWTSFDAGNEIATFTTKALNVENGMIINAKTTGDGFVKVEVLDSDGNEISAYCNDNAAIFEGDVVNSELRWRQGDIDRLPKESIKFRVTMKNSKLYSFEFKPVKNLVAWWKFEEAKNTIVYDYSGNQHHADIVGTQPHLWETQGGLYFDGLSNTHYLLCEDLAIDGNGDSIDEITISFWAKGDIGTDNNVNILWAYGNDGQDVLRGYFPYYNPVIDGYQYQIQYVGSDGSEQSVYNSDYAEGRDGQWHHWVFQKDVVGGIMRVYLDANLVAFRSGTKPIWPIDKIKIGSNGSISGAYKGYIKDFRIYDYSLDQQEISIVKDGGQPDDISVPEVSSDEDLIGWWKFNEGAGTDIDDYSGNNWKATVVGSGPHTWSPEGGIYLDGYQNTDYIEISDIDISDAGNSFNKITIAFWAKGDVGVNNDVAMLWGTGGPDGSQIPLKCYFPWYNSVIDKYQYQIQYIGSAGMQTCPYNSTAEESRDGQWHHWTFQKDASEEVGVTNVYLDGVLVSSRQETTYSIWPITDIKLGSNGNASMAYKGYVKDLRIYNSFLTEDDIDGIINTDTPGCPDIDQNGIVGLGDLLIFTNQWLYNSNAYLVADILNDGKVWLSDFSVLSKFWNQSCVNQ